MSDWTQGAGGPLYRSPEIMPGSVLGDALAAASAKSRKLSGWKTGMLAPVDRNVVTGALRPAVPMFVQDAIRGVMAPGKAMRGEYGLTASPDGRVSYDGMAEDAAALAGTVTLGAGAIPAEAGALRMGADNFASLLEQARNRLTTRNAAVSELVATGAKAIKFNGPSGRALASPDMSSKGKFRLTYFDKSGVPNGHLEFQSFEEAVRQALVDGFAAQKDTH